MSSCFNLWLNLCRLLTSRVHPIDHTTARMNWLNRLDTSFAESTLSLDISPEWSLLATELYLTYSFLVFFRLNPPIPWGCCTVYRLAIFSLSVSENDILFRSEAESLSPLFFLGEVFYLVIFSNFSLLSYLSLSSYSSWRICSFLFFPIRKLS